VAACCPGVVRGVGRSVVPPDSEDARLAWLGVGVGGGGRCAVGLLVDFAPGCRVEMGWEGASGASD